MYWAFKHGREGRAGQARSQEQPRIQSAKQQEPSDKRNEQKRNSAPDHGRPDLVGFETTNGQRLRNQDDGYA